MDNAELRTIRYSKMTYKIVALATVISRGQNLISKQLPNLESKLEHVRRHIESLYIKKNYSIRQHKRNVMYPEIIDTFSSSEEIVSQLHQIDSKLKRVKMIAKRMLEICRGFGNTWREEIALLLNKTGETLASLKLSVKDSETKFYQLQPSISLITQKLNDLDANLTSSDKMTKENQ